VILISNLVLEILDGSTIASTDIYGADKKTYINIGSGNVFKLRWETPVLTNDIVDRYNLIIKRYDPTLNVYYDILDKNIEQVNEFYVDSPMLPIAPEQYMLSVYLVAYSKNGSIITSNVITPYISAGGGTYVKVTSSGQPIMKRALGFVKVEQMSKQPTTMLTVPAILTDDTGTVLTDTDDKVLCVEGTRTIKATALLNRNGEQFVDKNGKALYAPMTRLLENKHGWTVVQRGYAKDTDGTWQANDIAYEVLQVLNEATGKYEILTDAHNEPIYIL
jgi:hypothetical protein